MKPWDTLYAATSTCIIKTGSTIKTTPHSWPPSSAFPNHGAPKLAVQVLPFLVYLNQTKIQQYLSLVVGSFGECFSDSSVTRMGVVPSVARWRGPDQDEVWRFQADNEAYPSNHPPWLVFGMVYQRKMKTQTETTIQPQLHHVLRNMKNRFCSRSMLWTFLSGSSLFWSGVMRALEVTALVVTDLVAYLCPFMTALTCTLSWYDNGTEEFSVSSPSVQQDHICEEGQPCCWDLSTCEKCVWTELVLLNIHRISTVSITLPFYEFYVFPLWNSMRMYSPFTWMKQGLL